MEVIHDHVHAAVIDLEILQIEVLTRGDPVVARIAQQRVHARAAAQIIVAIEARITLVGRLAAALAIVAGNRLAVIVLRQITGVLSRDPVVQMPAHNLAAILEGIVAIAEVRRAGIVEEGDVETLDNLTAIAGILQDRTVQARRVPRR